MADRLITASRRDLGFVVARALALLAWLSAASIVIVVVMQAIAMTKEPASYSDPHRFDWTTLMMMGIPAIVAIVTAIAGQRLWVGAGSFGDDGATAEAGGTVLLSRDLLVQGVAIGIAIAYGASALSTFLRWLFWVIFSAPSSLGPSPVTRDEGLTALVHGLTAGGLLLWAYQAAKRAVALGTGE